jgi:hypothetical protein
MERCAFCEAEDTMLYENGVPICLSCAEAPPESRKARIALFRDLHSAVMRSEAATDAFAAIASDIPSHTPHPDGIQRIQNASREMTTARKEMLRAHNRLNDFLNTGIVPDDLKRSG